MMAPTPNYQNIWECDAESFSVGEEPIRDDVEEEALDAEKEKKEDDEEGTVKEDNKEDTRNKVSFKTLLYQFCQVFILFHISGLMTTPRRRL